MNPSPSDRHEQAGAIGANRYRTILKLGEGGMAEVFLALQQGMTDVRRLVVIKRLRMMFAHSKEYQAMFLEEARLATRLNHPNVVHTYEVGKDADQHFIVMEYLAGHSLTQLLRKVAQEGLDFSIALRILIEVLRGLEYAHQQEDLDGSALNLVHRDISPSNIFVTYDGRIKILDFGIAKANGSSIETNVGTIKGKLTYMAPEQAKQDAVTMQADLYAVGVMLWEITANRRRWASDLGDVAIFGLLLENRPPKPPGASARGLPAELDAICLKALAPSPSARFKDATEFRRVLEELQKSLPSEASCDEVGALMSRCFAEEQEKQKRDIDEEMRNADTSEAEPNVHTLVWRKAHRNSGASLPTATYPPSSSSQALTTGLRKPVLWAIALATLVILATLLVTRPDTRELEPITLDLDALAQTEVVVTIVASPKETHLFWNDRLLLDNPTAERHKSSESTVTVRAEADGFKSEERVVSLNKNWDLVFDLVPLPSAIAADALPDEASIKTENKASLRQGKTPPILAGSKATVSTPPQPSPKVRLDTSDPWSD